MDIAEEEVCEMQDKLKGEHMEQAQRQQSLELLARGVAHGFNNLLTAIFGHADIALLKLPQHSSIAKNLETIKGASLKGKDLCEQLLTYSGQGVTEGRAFCLNQLVGEMVEILQVSISKQCVLDLSLDAHLPILITGSTRVSQVVMNLVMNASDAIGDRSGIIHISTCHLNCSQEYFSDDDVVKPMNSGPFVMLEVSDNGSGMNKETLRRIFEPFFTTKLFGRGLGLSAVIDTIRDCGGGLRVFSEPCVGTSFKVFFPAPGSSVAENQVAINASETHNGQFVGKVLLVDDDEMILSVCSRQLKILGLEVLVARDGQEGVEVYRKNQDLVDLVLLDLTMPKMDGEETFRVLRQLDPEIKVILLSGYAQEEIFFRLARGEFSGYLCKPYTVQQLSCLLSGILPKKQEPATLPKIEKRTVPIDN